jgi:hypothetical protein
MASNASEGFLHACDRPDHGSRGRTLSQAYWENYTCGQKIKLGMIYSVLKRLARAGLDFARAAACASGSSFRSSDILGMLGLHVHTRSESSRPHKRIDAEVCIK